jgi:hypothetical protein
MARELLQGFNYVLVSGYDASAVHHEPCANNFWEGWLLASSGNY